MRNTRKWEIDARVKKIEREALSGITVDKQKVATAEKLGREAFARGAKAVPAHDPELMALIAGDRMGDSIPVLKAWNRGWNKSNLAAPIGELGTEEIEMKKVDNLLPWSVEAEPVHGWVIIDANGSRVVRDIYWEQHARFIVRAVNGYEADKEALCGVAIMLNTELAKYENEPWAQRVRAANKEN